MLSRLLKAVFIIISAVLIMTCRQNETLDTADVDAVFVRIPPFYDWNRSPGENQCIFTEFLFPDAHSHDVEINCTGAGLANDDSLLWVSTQDDGTLLLNSEPSGTISDTKALTNHLAILFEQRKTNAVFEPGSDRVVKAVGIKLSQSAKYDDVMKVAEAVRDGQADPIVLILDGHLPNLPALNKPSDY